MRSTINEFISKFLIKFFHRVGINVFFFFEKIKIQKKIRKIKIDKNIYKRTKGPKHKVRK